MAILGKSKICPFKEDSRLIKKINYKEHKFLKKFLTDQGKIIPGHITGVCAKHQRHLSKAIKQARNISLLPYSVDPRHF